MARLHATACFLLTLLAHPVVLSAFDVRLSSWRRSHPPPQPILYRASTTASTAYTEGIFRDSESEIDAGGFSQRRARPRSRPGDDPEEDRRRAPVEIEELNPYELNSRFMPSSLDRHRFIVSPDAAYAVIFSWSVLVDAEESISLATRAWAEAMQTDPTPLLETLRTMPFCFALPFTIRRMTHRLETPATQSRLAAACFAAYERLFAEAEHTLTPGILGVIETLAQYGVCLAVTADVAVPLARAALVGLGINASFTAVVSGSQYANAGQMFMHAAVGVERPPARCAVFEERLTGILQAHEALMKAVAYPRLQPMYALRPADLVLDELADLSMVTLRTVFKQPGVDGQSLEEPEPEREKEPVKDYWGDAPGMRRRAVAEPITMDPDEETDAPRDGGGGGQGGGGGRVGGGAR